MNQKINLFRLKKESHGFKKGTLVLEGARGKDGLEFFNMSYELANGWGVGYSNYDIPQELLIPANKEEVAEVSRYLSELEKYDPKSCTINP